MRLFVDTPAFCALTDESDAEEPVSPAKDFSICVFAEPDADPTGGVLRGRLTASNLPVPATMDLPISVLYAKSDTMAEARRLADALK